MKITENTKISELKKLGYICKVVYWRRKVGKQRRHYYSKYELKPQEISPTGGYTEVFISSPEGEKFYGAAKCREDENFEKKLAKKICLGRIKIQQEDLEKIANNDVPF